jgi:hypothetical protein
MVSDEGTGKSLRIARIFYMIFLFAILIYADILYFWPVIPEVSKNVGFDKDFVHQCTIIFSFFGVLCLGYSFFIPKMMIQRYKNKPQPKRKQLFTFPIILNKAESLAFSIQIVRIGTFMATSVLGLVLGILGAGWQITLPFLAASITALVLTFPTQKRWQQLLEKLNSITPLNPDE